jgi:hypothetical protein
MAGQLTNADMKSEADLAVDGFGADKLTHTEKIYDPTLNQTLDDIINLGYASKAGVIGSVGAPQIVAAVIDLAAVGTFQKVIVFVKSNGGNIDIALSDIVGWGGFAGQELEIYGVSDVDTVTITDGHVGPITFTNMKIASYFYNGAIAVEKGRN